MRMVRLNIQLPQAVKVKLDQLRMEGTSASGFIRHLIEREFSQPATKKKGRRAL